MTKALRALALLIGLGVVSLLAGGAYFYFQLAPPLESKSAVYLIRPGTSLGKVVADLEQKGVIRNAQAARLYARLRQWHNQLKTGYYRFDKEQSATAVLKKIALGQTTKIPYTIPEGYRIDQAAKNLDQYNLSSARYVELATQPQAEWFNQFSFLKGTSAEQRLEGYLFPDTYYLSGSEEELIQAQLHRFEQVVLPLWNQRPANHPLDLNDTIKLASVVELEGLLDSELPIIAGVFLHRLRIGMPLQSDPTTEYALGWHQGAKGLSLEDIKIDSPYNTYRYKGLMPTPIGNPGKAAVQAVLYPKETPYLYFVARGDGSHAFSATYAEHLAAIRRIHRGK